MAHLIEQKDGVQVLKTDDLFNPIDNAKIVEDVEKCIAEGKNKFVVNLVGLPYMSSSGLSFLVSLLTRTRSAGGDLIVTEVSSNIKQLFLITKLNSVFIVEETEAEAIAFFKKEKVME